jgi:hypothetical protein
LVRIGHNIKFIFEFTKNSHAVRVGYQRQDEHPHTSCDFPNVSQSLGKKLFLGLEKFTSLCLRAYLLKHMLQVGVMLLIIISLFEMKGYETYKIISNITLLMGYQTHCHLSVVPFGIVLNDRVSPQFFLYSLEMFQAYIHSTIYISMDLCFTLGT